MSNYLNISGTISDAGFFLHLACVRINQTVRAANGLLWCDQRRTCSWAICWLLCCGRFRFAMTYIWHIVGMYIWLYGFYDHQWSICVCRKKKLNAPHRIRMDRTKTEEKRIKKKREETTYRKDAKMRWTNKWKENEWKEWVLVWLGCALCKALHCHKHNNREALHCVERTHKCGIKATQ